MLQVATTFAAIAHEEQKMFEAPNAYDSLLKKIVKRHMADWPESYSEKDPKAVSLTIEEAALPALCARTIEWELVHLQQRYPHNIVALFEFLELYPSANAYIELVSNRAPHGMVLACLTKFNDHVHSVHLHNEFQQQSLHPADAQTLQTRGHGVTSDIEDIIKSRVHIREYQHINDAMEQAKRALRFAETAEEEEEVQEVQEEVQ
jgi:hypothetical protein